MLEPQVMIIHQDYITAKSIQNRLRNKGYSVEDVVFSLDEIFHRVEDSKPDLVILDGLIKGSPDSLEIAHHIESCNDIPVILLVEPPQQSAIENTQFAFCTSMNNSDRELCLTIDLAMSRNYLHQRLTEQEQLLNEIIATSKDAVITIDSGEQIVSMNSMAENLTGWHCTDALYKEYSTILKIVEQDSTVCDHFCLSSAGAVEKACLDLEDHLLITRSGEHVPVSFRVRPMKNGDPQKPKYLVILKSQGE